MSESVAPTATEPLVGGARLIDSSVPSRPAGVVVVLHGGGSRGHPMEVSPAQLSVLRMIPIANGIAHATRDRVAVLRLLNSRRGWDTEHTPVLDVQWALEEVNARFGSETPVCLVGHSLGGRAALLSAGHPQVTGVVALAPWVYPSDVVTGAEGTPIVVIHGDADGVALPDRARQVADRLRRQTAVTYVSVQGGTHAMLRRRGRFDGLAAQCARWMLLGESDDRVVRRIAAGEPHITV